MTYHEIEDNMIKLYNKIAVYVKVVVFTFVRCIGDLKKQVNETNENVQRIKGQK